MTQTFRSQLMKHILPPIFNNLFLPTIYDTRVITQLKRRSWPEQMKPTGTSMKPLPDMFKLFAQKPDTPVEDMLVRIDSVKYENFLYQTSRSPNHTLYHTSESGDTKYYDWKDPVLNIDIETYTKTGQLIPVPDSTLQTYLAKRCSWQSKKAPGWTRCNNIHPNVFNIGTVIKVNRGKTKRGKVGVIQSVYNHTIPHDIEGPLAIGVKFDDKVWLVDTAGVQLDIYEDYPCFRPDMAGREHILLQTSEVIVKKNVPWWENIPNLELQQYTIGHFEGKVYEQGQGWYGKVVFDSILKEKETLSIKPIHFEGDITRFCYFKDSSREPDYSEIISSINKGNNNIKPKVAIDTIPQADGPGDYDTDDEMIRDTTLVGPRGLNDMHDDMEIMREELRNDEVSMSDNKEEESMSDNNEVQLRNDGDWTNGINVNVRKY